MRRKYRTGPNLFFIEFIIALFFFLIVSTICIRVFVNAHLVTQRAEALSHAQSLCASIAEAVEGGDGTAAAVLDLYPDAHEEDGALSFSYDRQFHLCEADDAFYTLEVLPSLDGQEKEALISFSDSRQNVLYELSVRFHRPMSREEALS